MIEETIKWKRIPDQRLSTLAEGALMRMMVDGKAICFLRMSGRLHALADRCPHQGNSFIGGWCEEGHLICPWHRMAFDPVTGRCRSGGTANAEVFPVEERAEGTFIGFERTTFSLFGFKLW